MLNWLLWYTFVSFQSARYELHVQSFLFDKPPDSYQYHDIEWKAWARMRTNNVVQVLY
jgi:hypothetical protein